MHNTSTPNFQKLVELLKELFQLDQAELDFGIYRILNQKRDEVTRFLERDLLPQVKAGLSSFKSADKVVLENELDHVMDFAALEDEVYSHLYTFFRRYYKDGDFLSLRRYKEGVYAIPYEGEEVKLHWANADQYYIKSGEQFRDYVFKLPDGRRTHFKLVEADTELGDNKPRAGGERRFILCDAPPCIEDGDELLLRFEYRPDEQKRKQAELNQAAAQRLLGDIGLRNWLGGLSQKRPTEKNPNRTLLEKHLNDYTSRNTFDYFIHKDLGGFLRRELDFFIKNEIMHLDDIESDTAPRVEQYLSKIKALRGVARKIIRFLEQLENFQKKLWLKKKFVVETHWCLTLDRVPEALYPDICANATQREEWVRLFAIDELKPAALQHGQQIPLGGSPTAPAYSVPLTVEFLKANPFLVLDTKFFSTEFKHAVLASVDDIDAQCDGVLVHGENFGALNILQERYREKIKCIYADPPYNTGGDDFMYKDGYIESSWMSFIEGRLSQTINFLHEKSLSFFSIDEIEQAMMNVILSQMQGKSNFVGMIVWKSRQMEDARALTGLSNDHEYIICYRNSSAGCLKGVPKDLTKFSNPDNDGRGPWRSADLTGLATKEQRPNLHYDLTDPMTSITYSCPQKGWRYDPTTMRKKVTEGRILFPNDPAKRPRHKLFQNEMDSTYKSFSSVILDIITADGTKEINSILASHVFIFPKPSTLIQKLIDQIEDTATQVLDFFAGSGTTAHAVINLNREDGGTRKYILVEVGEHFNTVLKPRIQKVVYSDAWKDGKPVSRKGSSHMFKYFTLESYEDALNNLELTRDALKQRQLENPLFQQFREDYLLGYMLDLEAAGSASLLNLDGFDDPFAYKMKIAMGSAGETKTVCVDLIETFNYLIGLRVKTMDVIRGVCVVTGLTPRSERALVIWRKVKEMDNATLDAFFRRQDYRPRDAEFDLIYVNGDNNLENLRREDETWKVRLIEQEFKRLMFAEESLS